MSRIDDEIEDRRNAERLVKERLQQEMLAKKKAGEVSEFDRRMGQTRAQQAMEQVVAREQIAKQDEEHRRDPRPGEVLKVAKEQARQSQEHLAGQVRQQRAGEEAKAGRQQTERQVKDAKEQRAQDASQLLTRREIGDEADQARVERRTEGFRFGDDLQHGRSEGQGEQTKRNDNQTKGDGTRKVEREGGEGQSKGGQGNNNQGGGEPPPTYKLNPALLAPPPLARPKDDGRSERLRQLANEIAQKIVERARVGRNAAGQAEFQMDLRSNVLSGLHIRVSAQAGRISALFSGHDRKVLAMLKENADSLKQALQARGLTLVELKVEARA
jgi:hypothetical protein